MRTNRARTIFANLFVLPLALFEAEFPVKTLSLSTLDQVSPSVLTWIFIAFTQLLWPCRP